jgi:hypothetical protein
MDTRNFSWSPSDKKIARAAFDKAYSEEMKFIQINLIKKTRNIQEAKDVWGIYDYLSDERKQVAGKYDYRYSELIIVFARLLGEGFISKDDLEGLSAEKMEAVDRIISFVENKE